MGKIFMLLFGLLYINSVHAFEINSFYSNAADESFQSNFEEDNSGGFWVEYASRSFTASVGVDRAMFWIEDSTYFKMLKESSSIDNIDLYSNVYHNTSIYPYRYKLGVYPFKGDIVQYSPISKSDYKVNIYSSYWDFLADNKSGEDYINKEDICEILEVRNYTRKGREQVIAVKIKCLSLDELKANHP